MKCPLFIREVESTFTRDKFKLADCLKKECAWWGNNSQQCAIPRLANELYSLVEVMEEIRDHAPSELYK